MIAKLQGKYLVFNPKLNILLKDRIKIAHNPDKNSLVFPCLRPRNFHTTVFPFNLSGIWHRRGVHQIHLPEKGS
jgi:hypothetical protein